MPNKSKKSKKVVKAWAVISKKTGDISWFTTKILQKRWYFPSVLRIGRLKDLRVIENSKFGIEKSKIIPITITYEI
jgi:hypothetical protein